MKKVVDEPEVTEKISISNLDNRKYYGYITNPTRVKGFLMEKQTAVYRYCHDINSFKHGGVIHRSLLKMVLYLLKDGAEVYEFETQKELFAWLAAD